MVFRHVINYERQGDIDIIRLWNRRIQGSCWRWLETAILEDGCKGSPFVAGNKKQRKGLGKILLRLLGSFTLGNNIQDRTACREPLLFFLYHRREVHIQAYGKLFFAAMYYSILLALMSANFSSCGFATPFHRHGLRYVFFPMVR